MSFIDWSDAEGMFGLLIDYVADEQRASEDSARRKFLSRLQRRLEELRESFESMASVEALTALHAIRHSIGEEFESDAVVEHLSACIEELERLRDGKPVP
jgi:hypothetical protein